MGLVNVDDLELMHDDLMAVRDDRSASIVIRRGDTTLGAQTVRIARLSSGGLRDTDVSEETRAKVVVLGDTGLDIQIADRFTDQGVLYRVTFVRPNRRVAVMAECEAIE